MKQNVNTCFYRYICALILIITLPGNADAQKQNDLDVLKNYWLHYGDASNSLYSYLTGEAFKMLDKREEGISRINNIEDWKKKQADIIKVLWDITGAFTERTPLNATITGKFKKDGYRVENIIYESLPGFYVTASLFIPEKLKKPAPAILFCSGHSHGVYRLESYQLPLLNLVKKGFIVLAIDPVGQGERLQYPDPVKGESVIGSSTKEHSYAAAQVFLIGKSVSRYFIHDGIRGIDYLISRREVDPARIGVHGLSGGGTQTAFISALDERVAASAPACYITSYRRLLESIGVQDGEQNFYHGMAVGIDHADLIEARAPKPTLIMANTRDFFSIQGARETFGELKRVYSIFGKPGNVQIIEDDFGHGYTKKNREAMYAFFQESLKNPGSSLEEEVEFSSEKELQKTSTGQVLTSVGGETIFSLNQKDAVKLIDELHDLRDNSPDYLNSVISGAKKLSGFIQPERIDDPVFAGRFQKNTYMIEKYFVKGEGDHVIPYLLFIPERSNNKSLIYLHPSGKTAEASEGGEIEEFVKQGFTVLAPDLIGMGEMGPGNFKGDAVIGGVSYNMWFTSTIIAKSIVGIRAADVIRLRMLLQERNRSGEIFGLARKELTPVMLYASAFDKNIIRIALIEPYSSYCSAVMNRFYYPGFIQSFVPGSLTAYDLPDLAASLAPRKLIIINMTDANGESKDQAGIRNDLDVIREAYKMRNVELHLMIGEKPEDIFQEWAK